MNKIYFCFLLSVLVCLHNYATGMIVFWETFVCGAPAELSAGHTAVLAHAHNEQMPLPTMRHGHHHILIQSL